MQDVPCPNSPGELQKFLADQKKVSEQVVEASKGADDVALTQGIVWTPYVPSDCSGGTPQVSNS